MGICGCAQKAAAGQPKQPRAPLGKIMAESRPPAEPVRRGTCVTVDSIRDVYIIDAEKLGEGAYGSVCRGTHRVTGDERAIKRISKTHPIDELREETAIMKMMDHPNIIRLFDTYQN